MTHHRRLVLTLAAATFGACCLAVPELASAQQGTLSVHDAWVLAPMGSRPMTGLFAVVENAGAAPRAVVSASSDAAEQVELHEMKHDGGMMSMLPVKQIDVPAHGKTELKPGSFHLMLFGLKGQLVVGEKINVTVTFDDGSKVTAAAVVRNFGSVP